MEPDFQARGISKSYGSVQALSGVDFTVRPGEIVALLGDNGAGKSTLVKCLSGAVAPDSGEIYMDGRPIRMQSPHDARDHGIETVYQDLALVPHMDYAANLFLGRETMRRGLAGRVGLVDRRAMKLAAAQALEELGMSMRPDAAVGGMSGGQRQAVAIMRAAYWGKKVVLLDEPTAALGVERTARVLELIRRIRERGIGVVLISHNMPNVFALADRIVVLRHGRVALESRVDATSTEEVVASMIGGTLTRPMRDQADAARAVREEDDA